MCYDTGMDADFIPQDRRKSDAALVLGILSVVFIFICQIAGLILGIIGLRKAGRKSAEGSDAAWVLNVVGIVINSVILFLVFLAIIFGTFIFFGLFQELHFYHLFC